MAKEQRRKRDPAVALSELRNVGKAMLADFERLGIATIAELATQDADGLYMRLCEITRCRHDPCVHDTFAAAIHQARTGEALNWWAYSAARKARHAAGLFQEILVPKA